MMDWESSIADPMLELDGQTAQYEDRDGTLTDLTVIFRRGYVGVNALGQTVDDHQLVLLAKRSSALSVARVGESIWIADRKYGIARQPQDDGTVWVKVHLEGPIDER